MPKRTDVSIESKKFSVTPGDTVHTIANVLNSGNTLGQFTFRIEGLDSDWYNLPVSSTTLFPHDEEKLTVSLHPPRTDRTKPGLYPFSLVIDCRENPDDTEQLALTLEVRDIPELQFELVPQQITGNKGTFKVIVNNPGDKAAGIQLRVTDYDRIVRCNLQPAELPVPGGGSSEATLEVKLRWWHFFRSKKEYDFTVLAGESDDPDKIKSLHGQLLKKQRKWRLPFRITVFKKLQRQKLPPDITGFEAVTEDRRRYKLVWTVEHAASVALDNKIAEFQGALEVNPIEATSYTLTARNKQGTVSRTVTVEPLPLPAVKYSDRILVSMMPNSLSVNAGSEPVEVDVEIQNIGSIVDKFSMEIDGIPRSWYSLSAPMVALMPHARDSIHISFHPPKAEGVISDKYLFAVIAKSQSIPEDSASVTGYLEILPSVDYGISLKPYRILSRRKCTFQVQITNKDVTEAELFIDVVDTENGLRFKLENDSPEIPPWQTINVPMLVKPKRNSIIGEIKRYDINLTATTAEGLIQIARCQMDHKPLLSSWRPIFRMIKYAVIIGVAGFAIYYIIRMGGGWSSLVRDPQAWLDGTIRHIRGWFY